MDSNHLALLSNLEQAAEVVLARPDEIDAGKRREAEAYFLEFKKSKSSFELCRSIFESAKNEFVIFQAAQAIKESTLREWSVLDCHTPSFIWQYLTQFVTQHSNLSGYVLAEILHSVSVIIKRGTVDGKSGTTDPFFQTVGSLIGSGEIQLMLLSLCTEYCTSWRSASVGIAWDFHVRAKRVFETKTLKRVFELTVQVLHQMVSHSDGSVSSTSQAVLCNRLLCVAESVLNWHFGSRVLPRRLTFSMEFSSTVALRPPESWKDIFLDENVLSFFFTLHSKVRHNSQLAHHSLQCLIQLGSLSGEVFADGAKSRNDFLAFFIQNILQLFRTGPASFEVLNCCLMLNKILTYHPLPAIMRLPDETLQKFVQFITDLSCDLCHKAVDEDLRGSDETQYHEALTKLLDGLAVLLRAELRFLSQQGMFSAACSRIFSAYFANLMAPPGGSRPIVEHREEIADLEEDDREHYSDVLGDIGIIGRHGLNHVIPMLSSGIGERLSIFSTFMADWNVVDVSSLTSWQEDMHWLLLIIGYTLTGEDCDCSSFMHTEVLNFSKEFREKSSIEGGRRLILSCLRTPESVAFDGAVEPLIMVLGAVLLWGVIEQRLLFSEGGTNLLSPQLASTTLWCLRRMVSSFSSLPESKSSLEVEEWTCGAKSVLVCGTDVSVILVEFLVHKAFGSLKMWSGEEAVAEDAVALLISLTELQPRADEAASSGSLMQEISTLRLDQLNPTGRKGVLKALVMIGATSENDATRNQMYSVVLDPLGKQFQSLVSGANLALSAESDLLDILDCYGGIAGAAQLHSAKFLFNYFAPVLSACVELIGRCKDRQAVVDGVLELFVEVTKKTAMYLEDKADSERLYKYLLELLKCYAENQAGKYVTEQVEEDKASDLSLVMDVLTNIMSKDILILAATEESDAMCSARVALLGLEILMPIMSEDLLRFPNLCQKYYRLILFVSEMYPENVMEMSQTLIETLIHSVSLGLSNQFGTEPMKLSMELLSVIATYVCQNESDIARQIKGGIAQSFTKIVFEACLSTSGEVDVFSDAAITLYALICCNKAVYDDMVRELIASHNNQDVQNKLLAAFEILLPFGGGAVPLRKEKRAFRERFETFLNDIQGLLCLN